MSILVHCLTLLIFCLLISSGSSFVETPFSFDSSELDPVPVASSSLSIPELDTTPVFYPTTPVSPQAPTAFTSPPAPTVVTSPPAPTTVTSPPAPTAVTTPAIAAPVGGGSTWCIANPSASPTALQVALDYACGYGGADCSTIQSGGSCYNPNTMQDHASYAFNDYYQKNPAPTSCVFGGAAQLTYTDPSNGNCHYASSASNSSTTSVPPPTMTTPTTPTTMTPTTTIPTTTPSSPTIYGVPEPTGLPSSAISVSCSLLLGMWSLLAAYSHL